MLRPILKSNIQNFITENIGADLTKLALLKNPFPEVNWIEVLNQISGKTKAKFKLPTWFATKNIIYPAKVNIEQTSSEKTAAYKANLVSGKNLIDLSGGFGVDAYYFAKNVDQVVHCEIDPELSAIVAHNFRQLQIENIVCVAADSSETLQKFENKFDWIYIDPSRRNESKGKVFMLRDCFPDIPNNLDLYFKFSRNILVKTSPMLDITAGLSELKEVRKIHIVAVENEVKELIWEMSAAYQDEIQIKTINFSREQVETFEFSLTENRESAIIGLPKKYLYEPNNAVMKSGGFDLVGIQYGLHKLHQHSHLYTSDELIQFPGRVFNIENQIPYTKSEMKNWFENEKFNITVRNFPETVEHIRKKWKIKEGGNRYCFFTTDANHNKIVLICTKITTS